MVCAAGAAKSLLSSGTSTAKRREQGPGQALKWRIHTQDDAKRERFLLATIHKRHEPAAKARFRQLLLLDEVRLEPCDRIPDKNLRCQLWSRVAASERASRHFGDPDDTVHQSARMELKGATGSKLIL